MSNVLDTIAQDLEARKAKALVAYRSTVKAIADDAKPPSVATIESTLRDAGQTIEQLRQDVEVAKERNRLRATVAHAEELEADRDKINAAIAKADEVLAAAQEAHKAGVGPLHDRIRQINDAHTAAGNARTRLQQTTPDWFDDRKEALQLQLNAAAEELKASKIHHREMLSRKPAPVEGRVDTADHADWQEGVKRAQTREADAQAEVERLVAEQESLLAEAMAS